jgi:glycosyltransferase involved in cell wall biosynthesis
MKISIITAVYNCVDTIGDALDSVRGQTHDDIELIVIDGASSDGTRELLQARAAEIDILVSERDDGIYDALNKGVRLATGAVIGFLHADDILADPEVLTRVSALFSAENPDAVYGDLVYVRKSAPESVVRYWQAGNMDSRSLWKGWMPPHPCLYLKRSVYEHFGLFNTTYAIAADYDFMLRILKPGTLQVRYLPGIMVRMRLGGTSNRGLANLWRKSREDLRALHENRVGGVLTLLRKNLGKLPQFIAKAP